jgi:hypothetical protein
MPALAMPRRAVSPGDIPELARGCLTCGGSGGQGRGRTADLPIFRPNLPVPGGRSEPNPCSGEERFVPYSSLIQEAVLANPLAESGGQGWSMLHPKEKDSIRN